MNIISGTTKMLCVSQTRHYPFVLMPLWLIPFCTAKRGLKQK